MFKSLLIVSASLFVVAGSAHAAAEKPKEVGQYVDLQPVALPIVVEGQLVNYVFVYVRINLNAGIEVAKIREKEPFFRDALVRDAHKTPFVAPGDWEKVDAAKLVAALTRDASTIAGPGVVSSVSLTSQIPQRHVMPPRPVKPDHL